MTTNIFRSAIIFLLINSKFIFFNNIMNKRQVFLTILIPVLGAITMWYLYQSAP
jgi:hypothetical protein